MLPIVQRELRVASRDPKLYRRRMGWGFLQAIFACIALLFSGGGARPGTAESFFSTFSGLALVLCLLEGVRKTSDSISAEKREGTLGLLFLSTLTGADVILGKLAGALIRSLGVLLPFIPILAISLLVGGTTAGEFWRVTLVLMTTLLASLSLCLLISTLSREQSIVTALIFLALWCVAPLFLGAIPRAAHVRQLSPIGLLNAARDVSYRLDSWDFWFGIMAVAGLAILSLAAASLLAPRVWQTRAYAARGFGKAVRDRTLREKNAVLWLSYNRKGQRLLSALTILLLLAGIVPPLAALRFDMENRVQWALFPGLAAGGLLLVIWLRVAAQTTASMSEAQRNGTLELVLSTPVTVEEVIKGQWLAIWRTIRFPGCAALGLFVCAFIAAAGTTYGQAIWTGKLVIELLLEVAVLGSLGMYMGLRCKTRAAAVVYTLLLGGLVPWITCVFTIAVQVVIIARSLDRVKARLNRIRNGRDEVNLLSSVLTASPSGSLPPVIR